MKKYKSQTGLNNKAKYVSKAIALGATGIVAALVMYFAGVIQDINFRPNDHKDPERPAVSDPADEEHTLAQEDDIYTSNENSTTTETIAPESETEAEIVETETKAEAVETDSSNNLVEEPSVRPVESGNEYITHEIVNEETEPETVAPETDAETTDNISAPVEEAPIHTESEISAPAIESTENKNEAAASSYDLNSVLTKMAEDYLNKITNRNNSKINGLQVVGATPDADANVVEVFATIEGKQSKFDIKFAIVTKNTTLSIYAIDNSLNSLTPELEDALKELLTTSDVIDTYNYKVLGKSEENTLNN